MIMNEVSGLQKILMFNSLMFFARRDKISVGFCYCVETASEKDSEESSRSVTVMFVKTHHP